MFTKILSILEYTWKIKILNKFYILYKYYVKKGKMNYLVNSSSLESILSIPFCKVLILSLHFSISFR